MVGIYAVKAAVGTPTKHYVETGARVDRKLPNEATIISRALTITMRSVRAVSATVAASSVSLAETGARIERNLAKRSQLPEAGMNSVRECSDRKRFFAKTKPICHDARSQRTSRPEAIDHCKPFFAKTKPICGDTRSHRTSRRDGARPSGNDLCENEANLP
jgi:hypothetical protein